MRKLAVALLFVLGAVSAAEDEVKLKNGDRLTGVVKGLSGGKLILETPYTGPIKIDWSQVVSVKTDGPVKVKLVTGDTLEGRVVPGGEGKLKVESGGTVAPVEVELVKISHLNEPPVQWHGNINAAAKSTDGNTHIKSFLISGEGIRETEVDQILIRAIFRYAEESHNLIERNAYGIGKYSYKLTPSFYLYVSEELSGDAFKDLTLGSVTSAGGGYQFVKESWIDFATEVGVAYISLDHKTEPDDSHMGARVAAILRVALPLGFEFKDTYTIYPNFEDSQDFQFRNEATLGTALGGGWSLLGGVITEYDRKPSPGLKRQDDTFYIGLGYKF